MQNICIYKENTTKTGMIEMNVLALYLPQFHSIKENDIWWGKGYTEWSAVKGAKKISIHHNQPKVPYNQNYYDLNDSGIETLTWQVKIAREYGIYGFCFYHYWFKGKKLLEKPAELLLNQSNIDINFCFCWANETWTKTWYGLEKEILIKQEYGNRFDWEEHFKYLLPFFRDNRYIKVNNKPMLNIYRTYDIKDLKDMLEIWNLLAVKEGFNGIYVVSANTARDLDNRSELFDAYYNFEPGYTLKHNLPFHYRFWLNGTAYFKKAFNKLSRIKIVERVIDANVIRKHSNIRKKSMASDSKIYPGVFSNWDNTPRRGYKGSIYINTSPLAFKKSLERIKWEFPDSEFLYINAWNEWGEGCYLEPDTENCFGYLEAVKVVFGDKSE